VPLRPKQDTRFQENNSTRKRNLAAPPPHVYSAQVRAISAFIFRPRHTPNHLKVREPSCASSFPTSVLSKLPNPPLDPEVASGSWPGRATNKRRLGGPRGGAPRSSAPRQLPPSFPSGRPSSHPQRSSAPVSPLHPLPQETHFLGVQNARILLTHFHEGPKLAHFAGVHGPEAVKGGRRGLGCGPIPSPGTSSA